MAIDPVNLDDLTWNEMVVAARRRIAAVSGARWTLHAPVDPGVTMLELFAWLLEQRVYWMDQVPDSLARGALALLGEEPKPTQSAATVMRFATQDNQPRRVRKLTNLALRGSVPPLVFSTRNSLTLLPMEKLDEQRDKLGLFIAEADRTVELERGRVLKLFPADGTAAEVKIVFHLRGPLPRGFENGRFSLLFDLSASASPAPQWSPGAPANIPPPAKIAWFYSGANGLRISFGEEEVGDGTGGLRRSGVATFPIKKDWQPETANQYAIWMSVERATFSSPPRIERLMPNVAIAAHERKTGLRELRRDWLPLPGNSIALADLPENGLVKDHPPIEQTVRLRIKERDGNWHRWSATGDLAFHGPEDRVFVVDRLRGEVRFGDGLNGRLPILAAGNEKQLKLRYWVGGGSAGQVGANLVWESDDLRATNIVPGTGGEEPETIVAARERMASTLKQRTRAVTREDYEEIARTTPGVAINRAHAAVGFHPAHPRVPVPGAVTVFVVPGAPREDAETIDESLVEDAFVAAPQPDPGALAAIRRRLNEARLVASEVFVLPPNYRPVALATEIETDDADRVKLSRQIERRLTVFLDPLIGGDDGQGWPFGEPLRPSAILREAQRAIGEQGTVTAATVTLLDIQSCNRRKEKAPRIVAECAAASNAAPASEEQSCNDVPIGEHDLVELRSVAVKFNRPGYGANNNAAGSAGSTGSGGLR